MSQWFNLKNDFVPARKGLHEYEPAGGTWHWRLPVHTDGRPEHAPVRMGVLSVRSNMSGVMLRVDDKVTMSIEGPDLLNAAVQE